MKIHRPNYYAIEINGRPDEIEAEELYYRALITSDKLYRRKLIKLAFNTSPLTARKIDNEIIPF